MTEFDNLSVMLLEDEFLIALDGEGMLNALGVKQIHTVSTLAAAAELVEKGEIDIAVLDLNINGEMSWSIADALHRRGVPIVFASGYELRDKVDSEFGVLLKKPYTPEGLKEALVAALSKPVMGPPAANQIGRAF